MDFINRKWSPATAKALRRLADFNPKGEPEAMLLQVGLNKVLDRIEELDAFVQRIADAGALNLDGHCDLVNEARKLNGTPGILSKLFRSKRKSEAEKILEQIKQLLGGYGEVIPDIPNTDLVRSDD